MVKNDSGGDRTMEALKKFLNEQSFAMNGKLPAERDLCDELGVSRGKLRKALALLEAEGQIWRHVGRGTFFGPRPVINISDVEHLSEHSRPAEVFEARLAIEPQLARLAALHGNASNFSEMRRCTKRCRLARDWRVYESWDNNFHQSIAAATGNKLLMSLFDTLNIVRRSSVWGQRRSTGLPPKDMSSFEEHDAIYDAIVARDADDAALRMRQHLVSVRERTFEALR